jgi:hypothetical protein
MKHEFQYELRQKSGALKISIVKAIHEKSAIQILKVKYPHCKIIDIKPVGKDIDWGHFKY